MHGIPECEQGSTRASRQLEDLNKVVSAISTVVESIDENSIRDHFKLGKFRPNAPKPRAVLVKLIHSCDVAKVLSMVSQVKRPIQIKPDLTRSQRSREAILLRERWKLIQQGVSRKSIRLRGYNSLYVSCMGLFLKIICMCCHQSHPQLSPQ